MNIRITLALRQQSNAEILIAASHYVVSMTNNPLFAAADIVAQVTATATAVTDLTAAMKLPSSDTKADQIRVTRDVLDKNLNMLAARVEAVANNPAIPDGQRVGIVHSAGMEVRSSTARAKRVFGVTHGDLAGSVLLTAESGPVAHEWQYTKDVNGLGDRVSARTTSSSSTRITNLDSLVKYAFFHKAVLADDADTEWEGPLMLTVH